MSCFWDAILNKIKIDDFNKLNYSGNPGPKEFADLLKKQNRITENVLWNSQLLTKQQCKENYEHIQNYQSSQVNQGYDCSICDPFLILICELLNININHTYLGNKIDYTNKKNVFNNNYTINIQSDKGHMW